MPKKVIPTNRLAVIDLGSNTFHLLIVEATNSDELWFEIYRERRFVYLAQDGLKCISNDAVERAINALSCFVKEAERHNVSKIVAIGTAALRSASNSLELRTLAKTRLDIDIKVISGKEEAFLIFKGLSITPFAENVDHLCIDIGGGSVEFIVSRNKKLLYHTSVNVGISVLKKQCRLDGLNQNEVVEKIQDFLKGKLSNLITHCKLYNLKVMVGASGPFEILEKLEVVTPNPKGNVFKKMHVLKVANDLTSRSSEERMNYPKMPGNRADLSLESFLIIKFILNEIDSLQEVLVSPFALKEGVILENI